MGSTQVNYTDRKILVKFEDGTIGEVQIWPGEMLDVKNKVGHKLYEDMRALPPGDPRVKELVRQQKEIYSAALEKLPPDWEPLISGGRDGTSGNTDLNAASEIGRPESMTSATWTSDQPSPGASTDQARTYPSDTAGRPSQLKNLISERVIDDTSYPDMGLSGAVFNNPVDGSAPDGALSVDGLAEANARLGTRESLKQLAEQHGIDPVTGDFAERHALQQLRAEGRLSPDDEALLSKSDDDYERSLAWGEALRVAGVCLT